MVRSVLCRLIWLAPMLAAAACTSDDDGTDTDTGVDTETGDTDTDETDTDTDETDTDTDETDTDTDETDTDTDDTDTDTGPCVPVAPHPQSFVKGVLQAAESGAPGVTHIQSVNLMSTGGGELLVSEAWQSRVRWLGDCDSTGSCDTLDLPAEWGQPSRSAVADMNGDGRRDVVVADIGSVFPTPDPVGTVRLLTAKSGGGFDATDVATFLGRTTCATPADLDGDGDLDLIVCEFGAEDGSLLWLEQDGSDWIKHPILEVTGPTDAWPVDLDGDGDLDLMSAVSQLEETVYVYENDGSGGFTRQQDAFKATVDYWGMSGVQLADLDGDGDMDAVLTNGDSLDGDLPHEIAPDSHYGVQWLENLGSWEWKTHEIVRHWGAYTTRIGDIDGDCDPDIAVSAVQEASVFPDRTMPIEPLFWLEQTSTGTFTKHLIDVDGLEPILFALELVDVDDDGKLDIVAGPLDLTELKVEEPHVAWWRGKWD